MEKRLAEIETAVRQIEGMEHLGQFPAFQQLLGVLRRNVTQLQQDQNKLSRQVQKNADEIQALNALRDATQGLIDIFETTLANKPRVFQMRATLLDRLRFKSLHRRQLESVGME